MQRKSITVADIARQAQVSQATVSRVLTQKGIVKGDTYDRVIRAMDELGYQYTEAIRTVQPSGSLIIINIPSLENPFYGEIVKGAKSSAMRHGYHLLINEEHVNRNTVGKIIELIKKTRAVGIITLNHIDYDVLQKLSAATTVIQCCEHNEEIDLPYVTIDDLSASMNLTEYLLSMGRRRIAFVSGPERYKYARHRLKGYYSALEAAGITPNPALVIQLPDVTFELAVSAAMQLLNTDNPPDAFFTCSDVYAAAVLRAAHLAGCRVPQDVMVTGFDNIQFSAMSIPSLTTVNQPKTQLGFMACELLLEKTLSPTSPNKKVILETELILRESTSL